MATSTTSSGSEKCWMLCPVVSVRRIIPPTTTLPCKVRPWEAPKGNRARVGGIQASPYFSLSGAGTRIRTSFLSRNCRIQAVSLNVNSDVSLGKRSPHEAHWWYRSRIASSFAGIVLSPLHFEHSNENRKSAKSITSSVRVAIYSPSFGASFAFSLRINWRRRRNCSTMFLSISA